MFLIINIDKENWQLLNVTSSETWKLPWIMKFSKCLVWAMPGLNAAVSRQRVSASNTSIKLRLLSFAAQTDIFHNPEEKYCTFWAN